MVVGVAGVLLRITVWPARIHPSLRFRFVDVTDFAVATLLAMVVWTMLGMSDFTNRILTLFSKVRCHSLAM